MADGGDDTDTQLEPPPGDGSSDGEVTEEVAQESLGTTSTRGFLWANVGLFVRYFSALVLAALLARELTTADYAVMVTLMIIVFYFDNALDLGMGAALVYEQEEGISERVQVAFTANFLLALILAVVAFLGAPLVVKYFNLDGYTGLFRCLAIVVILSGMTTVPWSLFTRDMEFKRQAVVELARDLSRFGVTLGLAVSGHGAWSIMIGLIVSYSVWLIMTWIVIRFRPRFTWDTPIVKDLFSYAWKMAGTRLLGILALNGDYLVVGNRRTDQYPTYYQAFRLPEFIMGGQLNAMSSVLFPMYSRIRSEGQAAMREAMFKALRLVGLFSLPVGIGLALVAHDSIQIMYGADLHIAVRSMELLSVTGCVVGIGYATGDLLFATGRPGIMFRLNMVMVPCMLIAMWFVAPQGIIWVATVHLVTAVIFTTIRQGIVSHMVKAKMLETAMCLVPGVVVAAFVLAFGLPVRLLTSEGVLSMVAIVVAGSLGALLALVVYRPARDEVMSFVTKLRG